METPAQSKPRINVLQACRAFAAFAIMLHHLMLSINVRVGPFDPQTFDWLNIGNYRVDFFFVLSGFMIYLVMRGKTLQGAGAAYRFLRTRALRIYPVYWIVIAMLLLRFLNDPAHDFTQKPWHWLPTLSLLPLTTSSAMNAAWTLHHEIYFYIVFAIGMLLGRLRLMLGLWAAFLLCALFGLIHFAPQYNVLTSFYNLEFCFGIAAGYVYFNMAPAKRYILLAALLFIAGYSILEHRLWFAMLFSAAIVLLAQLERERRFTIPRWLIFLGDSSYSLYLTHAVTTNLVTRAAALITDSPVLALAGCCLGAYAFAIVFYLGIEKPLVGWTKAKG